MTENNQKKESPIIKIYLVVLFLCGVGIWLALSKPQNNFPIDGELDNQIVNVLVSNGVSQSDVVSQRIQEKKTAASHWNEYYKKIKLNSNKNTNKIEQSFRSIARSMNLGLKKTVNNDNSIGYTFYLKNRNYSQIVFLGAKNK